MEKKTSVKRIIIRILLILIGGLLICDTFFAYSVGSFHLGVILPLLLGTPLLLCGLFYNKLKELCKKSKFFKAAIRTIICLYIVFTLLFGAAVTLMLSKSVPPQQPADALIVLGCGIRGDRPTLTMRYRLDKAIEYLNDNPDTIVLVSGGQSFDEICSEASVMKAYLIGHGIAEERILTEELSESTEENFAYSKAVLDSELDGYDSVAFVTTRFHVFRSELVAKKQGLDAQGIPAKGVWYITFNDYLREFAAITAYFLRGSI